MFWIDHVAFFESDIGPDATGSDALSCDIECVVPSADEVLAKYLGSLTTDFHLEPARVEERLLRSHVVVLAKCEGIPVSMLWLGFVEQWVSEIGRTLVLKPHEMLTYDEFTLPAWRGRGISPSLNRFADAYGAGRMATRRITWRNISNGPAVRVAEKLGHRATTVATTVRIAGHPFILGLDCAESPLEFRRR